MKDLLDKLKDLNRIDPMWEYTIQILPSGRFILHGLAPNAECKRIECGDVQCLREEMYKIVLNCKK